METLLQSWLCLNPLIYIVLILSSCVVWILLHFFVPILSVKVLRHPLSTQYQKWLVRCILAIFPPNNFELLCSQTKSNAGWSDIGLNKSQISNEETSWKRTQEKQDTEKKEKKDSTPWRRARAASFFVVSNVSLQRRTEAVAKSITIQRLLKCPLRWLHSNHFTSEVVISILAPVAAANLNTRNSSIERIFSPNFLLMILCLHRILGPLGIALRAVSEEFVEAMNEEMHGDSLSLLGEHHFLPNCLSGALWVVWILLLASSAGVNVSQLVSSMGFSGVILAIALQNYAADLVGSITLMADKRFSTGDMVRVGQQSPLYIIDKVGLLTTSVHCFNGPRAKVYFPNSVLVKSTILNESRQKQRRLKPCIYVDPHTKVAKLKLLPALLFDAVREKTSDFDGVHYVGANRGVGCELLGLDDNFGLRFEIAVTIDYSASDPLAYKRYINPLKPKIAQIRGRLINEKLNLFSESF